MRKIALVALWKWGGRGRVAQRKLEAMMGLQASGDGKTESLSISRKTFLILVYLGIFLFLCAQKLGISKNSRILELIPTLPYPRGSSIPLSLDLRSSESISFVLPVLLNEVWILTARS